MHIPIIGLAVQADALRAILEQIFITLPSVGLSVLAALGLGHREMYMACFQ
jgi:hypothetical protein